MRIIYQLIYQGNLFISLYNIKASHLGYFYRSCIKTRASLLAQMVKNLPAVQETWVQTLSQKDPLKKGVATHASILAWRIPRTKVPGGLSVGSQRVGHNRATNTHTHRNKTKTNFQVANSLQEAWPD